jgi:hypothetical protein
MKVSCYLAYYFTTTSSSQPAKTQRISAAGLWLNFSSLTLWTLRGSEPGFGFSSKFWVSIIALAREQQLQLPPAIFLLKSSRLLSRLGKVTVSTVARAVQQEL